MISILVGLSGFLGVGIPQALTRRPRALGLALALCVLSLFGALLTPWIAYLAPVLVIGTMIDGARYHRRHRPSPLAWRLAAIAFVAWIAIAFLLRELVIEHFGTPSSAMSPTFQIGDNFVVNKLVLRLHGPERGDIIVFRQPCAPDRDYVKRVVALAGDTVEVRCSVVYVNGTPVPSTLVQEHDRYRERAEGDTAWREVEASRYRETIGDHTFEVFHEPDLPARTAERKAGLAEDPGERSDFPRDRPTSCEDFGRSAASQPPGMARIDSARAGVSA